jgi:hypothetical protein
MMSRRLIPLVLGLLAWVATGCENREVWKIVAVSGAGDRVIAGCESQRGVSALVVVTPGSGGKEDVEWLLPPRRLSGLSVQAAVGLRDDHRAAVVLRQEYGGVLAWVDLRTGTWRQLLEGWFLCPPVWAPDGDRLAVVGRTDASERYMSALVVGVGAKPSRVLALRPPGAQVTDVRSVAWSPQADRLAVMARTTDQLGDVWVTSSSQPGQHWVRVSHSGEGMGDSVAWTADGRAITFVRVPRRGGAWEVTEVDPSGTSEPRTVLRYMPQPQAVLYFAIGPRLAVVREGEGTVQVIRPGVAAIEVPFKERPLGPCAWCASGRRIAVVAAGRRLYVVDTESGRSRLLFDATGTGRLARGSGE